MSRKLLIIGNGFDLAHGYPTRYENFLDFENAFLKMWGDDVYSGESSENYKSELLRLRSSGKIPGNLTDKMLDELVLLFRMKYLDLKAKERLETYSRKDIDRMYGYLSGNIWYGYFNYVHQEGLLKGENWIDFEEEISRVIQCIDDRKLSPLDTVESLKKSYDDSDERKERKTSVQLHTYNNVAEFLNRDNDQVKKIAACNTIRDLSEMLWKELQSLTRALEIYLSGLVPKMKSSHENSFPADAIKPDCVLSFNYTDTYHRLYDPHNECEYSFIHGKCRNVNELSKDNCNIVLGIDEYLDAYDRDNRNYFPYFKKFAQTAIFHNSNIYKEWLSQMSDDFKRNEAVFRNSNSFVYEKDFSDIWVFGHSLDVSDKSVLNEFISPDFTRVHVYANQNDPNDKLRHVTNLINIMGEGTFNKKKDASLLEFC